ncbi:MAG: GntR family transcriptional regulator [Oscillospiraceae bacterium]|nr:GntR family transcriptional regulator [Oscillospiraceae bacterium]
MNARVEDIFHNDSPYTLYYQLEEKLAKKILNNEWKPGQKIPSEAELCGIYNVSRITVRKAVENLTLSGQLIKHQGKGTFVANAAMEHRLSKFYSFSEVLKKKGMKERAQMLSFKVAAAAGKISGKLNLQPKAQVFVIKRLRMADELPYTVETSYIPHHLCPGLNSGDIIEHGLYDSMRALSIFPERAVEEFRATAVRKSEADHMKVNVNSPAIQLERTTYSGIQIIEYCSSIVRGDFFTYTVELK